MRRRGAPTASGGASRSRDTSADAMVGRDGVYAREITLWTHQPPNFSTHSFVLNPAYALPQVSDAELLVLTDAAGWASLCEDPGRVRRALVFTPAQALADVDVISRQQQLQLSIAKNIAGLYGFANRTDVVLGRTSRAAHTIDHVELYFKDQYIGRSDMWRLSTSLQDQCVYVGQKIQMPAGMRATIGRLYIDGKRALSGYVAPSTKAVFRSESAKYDILIQMSKEMWEFDEGGEIYYEKVLQGFLPALLSKWDAIGTNHIVSVVLFTRVLYAKDERDRLEGLPVQQTCTGQLYVDYYKVIVDLESNTHWPTVMRVLKEEFFRFQHDILLQPRRAAAGQVAPPAPADDTRIDAAAIGGRVLLGEFAHAHEGNVLEAVNLALNPFDKHYIDRDLTRTGFELVLITAGTGHFQVDKALLRTTTQRMSEIGISVDLVCLAQMPLHTAPIFYFRSAPPLDRRDSRTGKPTLERSPTDTDTPLYSDSNDTDDTQTYYFMPYWINCSFYNQEQDKSFRADRFVSRCKMDGLRMIELMGSGHQDLSIPYLDLSGDAHASASAAQRRSARERFDANVFRGVGKAAAPLSSPGPVPGPSAAMHIGMPAKSPRQRDATSPGRGRGARSPQTTRATSRETSRGSHPVAAPFSNVEARPPSPPRRRAASPRRSRSRPPSPVRTRAASPGRARGPSPRRSRSHSRAPAENRARSRVRAQIRYTPGSRAPSITSHASFSTLLDDPGKAPPLVAETVTELVAMPAGEARARPKPVSFLRSFLGRWGLAALAASRAGDLAHTSAKSASALISEALAHRTAEETSDALLLVHPATESVQIAEAAPVLLPFEEAAAQPLVNPSNPRAATLHAPDSLLLRWQHVFLERTNHHAVKWWSMTSPACLPLTTQHLPTDAELQTGWEEYPYSVSVYSDAASILLKRGTSTSPALAMLREMCAQRLSQGFQFVERQVLRPGYYAGRESRHYALQHPAELLRPGNFSTGDPIYLSTTTQIHCITYNRQAGMIHVKRYLKKTPYSTEPVSYRCCIWPRHLSGYQVHHAHFAYPDPHAYNWTYLDSLIAGYEETLTDSLRFWRARFVLVPCEGSPPAMTAPSGEKLSDEEVRLLGTDRLAELFARAEYHPPHAARPERNAVLRFLPTTLDPSSSMLDTQFIDGLRAVTDELSRRRPTEPRRRRDAHSRSLATLAAELRQSAMELKIHDRLWDRVLYPDTFTGTDLVNYLCRAYSDVRARDDAVLLGRQLLDEGYIEHVRHVHGFLDGHYFYRLAQKSDEGVEWAPPKTLTSPRRARTRDRLQLSRSLLIDLDPGKKSDRAEIAVLHHDWAHNAENGFNFQIHWLGTTARLIEDIVQTWTRTVERYGLRLVEAPIGQIKDVSHHNPFQAPLPIALALAPPARDEYAHLVQDARLAHSETEISPPRNDMEYWLFRHVLADYAAHIDQLFEFALLRHFGFVLDQEAASRYPPNVELLCSSRPTQFEYSQFVHRSGIAFAQVRGGADGFLWLNNRLLSSHLPSVKNMQGKSLAPPPDADELRRTFQRFCDDKAALETFYQSVWDALDRLTGVA